VCNEARRRCGKSTEDYANPKRKRIAHEVPQTTGDRVPQESPVREDHEVRAVGSIKTTRRRGELAAAAPAALDKAYVRADGMLLYFAIGS
jgi:hypothetical protein